MAEQDRDGRTELEIRLNLPDSLAREARVSGLLEPESLESMLRKAVQRHRVDRLFEAADRLAAIPLPSLTEAELEEEIETVRAQRSAHARGR